jgi:hypothetical protein
MALIEAFKLTVTYTNFLLFSSMKTLNFFHYPFDRQDAPRYEKVRHSEVRLRFSLLSSYYRFSFDGNRPEIEFAVR